MTAMIPSSHDRPSVSRKSLWLKIFLPFLLLALGGGVAVYFLETRPTAKRRPAVSSAPLVLVTPMQKIAVLEKIRLMGTVIPEKTAEIRSPVTGTLLATGENFYPGGDLAEGELLVEVDPADYRIAVERAAAFLEKAKADLALEKGRAAVAISEIKAMANLMGEDFVPTDLALRKPQMQQMEADISAAKADLEMAELQLMRTRIVTPFPAVLTSRHGVAGSRVSTGEVLATLVGREKFWIEVRVPMDKVDFLREEGHPKGASIAWIHGTSGLREGYVFKVLPDLSEASRMVRVLVVVEDPLGKEKGDAPVFLGDYLSLDLEGRYLEDGFRIPHAALRAGDRIWVVDGENRLHIVNVSPFFSDEEGVYASAPIKEGSVLVVSDLGLAVEGMAVDKEMTGQESENSVPAGGQ